MHYFSSPTKRAQATLLAADLVVAAAILALGIKLYPFRVSPLVFVIWPAILPLSLFVLGTYSPALPRSRLSAFSVAGAVAVAAISSYPFLAGPDRQRILATLVLGGMTWSLLLTLRLLYDLLAKPLARARTLFVLFSDEARTRFAEALPVLRQHCVPTTTEATGEDPDATHAEVAARLEEGVGVVVFEPSGSLPSRTTDLLIGAAIEGTRVIDFIQFYASTTGRLPLELIGNDWLLQQGLSRRAPYLNRLRRVASALVAIGLLLVTAPLMLIVALAVWLESGGPVIFRQERLGLFRRPFTLLKFRSMRLDAEEEGPRWAEREDTRVTRVGRFLRKTHLDELPQLLNLLRGDMAVVGPRPIREHFARQLAEEIPLYNLRFLCRPGITGWSQVLGPYGSTVEEHRQKLEMDLYYLQHATPFADVYVLLKTVRKVLAGEGI